MSVEELDRKLRADGRRWWICRCGRPMYLHSMRTRPNTGGREHVCGKLPTGRFEPETLPLLDYSHEKGLHAP